MELYVGISTAFAWHFYQRTDFHVHNVVDFDVKWSTLVRIPLVRNVYATYGDRVKLDAPLLPLVA